MILGYDAHEVYQGKLNYDALKEKGGKFIIIKAGEGWKDYESQDYVKLAKDNGLLTGSYWYYRQEIIWDGRKILCEPKRQAQIYFEATKGNQDLPPALDIEKTGNPYFRPDDILTCLQEIERLFGRIPMIYSNKYILQDDLHSPVWGSEYPLWLAQYRKTSLIELPKPFTSWAIHQFSDKIKVDGTTIDHNFFNGDMIDLLAFCEMGEIPEPPEQEGYVEIVASAFLRFRPLPEYNKNIKTLIVERGEVLQIAGTTIYEPPVAGLHDGITWLPVYIPSKYGTDCIGYISADKKYVRYL